MWKSIRAFFTALLVLVLGYGVVDLWARRSAPALPAIPQPNGYHELLRISDEIQVPKTDGLQSNPALLRETATKNKEALERLHKTVRSEVGVPLRTTKNWVEEHDQEVKNIKRLGMALVLQGRDHLLAGRTNQAADCALDTILLGHAMRTGGIFSDGMNGLLVETIGAGTLLSLVEGLDADFCRGAARELELMESKCEAPERILETERNWSATSFGLVHLIVSRVMAKTHTRRETEFLTRYETTTRRTRELILSLAAQAVELETGETVTDPTALVPAVLKAVPIDPQTGKAFERVPGRSILIGDPSG